MTKMLKVAAALGVFALMPVALHAQATATTTTTTTKVKATPKYDCSKAGNKNKAVCKAAAATAPVIAPKASTTATSSTTATTTTKKSLFGGMMGNKATVATKTTKSVATNNPNEVAYTTKSGKVIHYDCSKAGNKNKKACQGH